MSDPNQKNETGPVKETERGSPTTQPAAVVGNPAAGRKPKEPPKDRDNPRVDSGAEEGREDDNEGSDAD